MESNKLFSPVCQNCGHPELRFQYAPFMKGTEKALVYLSGLVGCLFFGIWIFLSLDTSHGIVFYMDENPAILSGATIFLLIFGFGIKRMKKPSRGIWKYQCKSCLKIKSYEIPYERGDSEINPAEIDIVQRYLSDMSNSSPQYREQAIMALGDLGDQRAVEPLFEMFSKETLPNLKKATSYALLKLKDTRSLDYVHEIINNAIGAPVRVQSMKMLALYHNDQSIEVLKTAAKHKDKRVSTAAIEMLGEIGDVSVIESLNSLRNESDIRIQELIDTAVKKISSK